jgi:dihydropteroate synthase-like protein
MRYLFVTGKLAEPSLRAILADLAPRIGLDYEIAVLNISVAALMTPSWVARRLVVPESVERIMLPGHCTGDLTPLRERTRAEVVLGPVDLRDLPQHFGHPHNRPYGQFDIEILAEINHAPRLELPEILARARQYREDGADIIDLGCDPGANWAGVGEVVRALRSEGFRVSIDSMEPAEIAAAAQAGAELVLSVNSTNLEAARSWGIEVVAIPDQPSDLNSLERTLDKLTSWGVPQRIDPILEPIGFGFAPSLGRYIETRRRYPQAAMLMGVGNLTELTEVDSAGINVLLLGFCQELGIKSVLTTEVINWSRSSVRELDAARRLVHHACTQRTPPKHIDSSLVMLRDPRVREFGKDSLARMASQITDRNFRIFAEGGQIHVMNRHQYWAGDDPFDLLDRILQVEALDPSHAFYLGYEMAKAVTALTLGKNYVQDQALSWGLLTRPEESHRARQPNDPGQSESASDQR